MVITRDPQRAAAISAHAQRTGVAPEVLPVNALREQFLAAPAAILPQDDWERRLLGLAKDCGVSLSDVAVSSEGLYERIMARLVDAGILAPLANTADALHMMGPFVRPGRFAEGLPCQRQ